MNKTFIALALGLSLGITACRTAKDEPKTNPDINKPTPEKPVQPEKPAEPEAKIIIENGVLKSYPEAKTAEDGAVTLDAMVTEVGEGAFAGNTKIKTLVAPGLKKISARAFQGATAFHLLDLSSYKAEGGHDYPETAADAFVGTPADKVLKLPASPSYTAWFEFLALHTFGAIEGLQSNLPAGAKVVNGELQSLPRNYRAGSNGLLVLPETVTKLGEAFLNQDNNSGVKLVYAPAVTEVGNGAFSESNLTLAHFPKLKKIGIGAFCRLSSVKIVNFPQVEEIGDLCFLPADGRGRTILATLILPSLKKVGKGTFAGSLAPVQTLVLGAKPELDKTPYTSKMTDALEGQWVPFLNADAITFSGTRAKDATLYVKEADLTSYGVKEGEQWEGFTLRILK